MPLHAKTTHTEGDEFLVEFVNPRAPNGRPLSQSCVMSYADLMALKELAEQVERGQKIAQVIATDGHVLPESFQG